MKVWEVRMTKEIVLHVIADTIEDAVEAGDSRVEEGLRKLNGFKRTSNDGIETTLLRAAEGAEERLKDVLFDS